MMIVQKVLHSKTQLEIEQVRTMLQAAFKKTVGREDVTVEVKGGAFMECSTNKEPHFHYHITAGWPDEMTDEKVQEIGEKLALDKKNKSGIL